MGYSFLSGYIYLFLMIVILLLYLIELNIIGWIRFMVSIEFITLGIILNTYSIMFITFLASLTLGIWFILYLLLFFILFVILFYLPSSFPNFISFTLYIGSLRILESLVFLPLSGIFSFIVIICSRYLLFSLVYYLYYSYLFLLSVHLLSILLFYFWLLFLFFVLLLFQPLYGILLIFNFSLNL